MPYNDDEAKRAARARLQARMERRNAAAYGESAAGAERTERSGRSSRDGQDSRGQQQRESSSSDQDQSSYSDRPRRPRPSGEQARQGSRRPRSESSRANTAGSRPRAGQARTRSSQEARSASARPSNQLQLPFELPFPITPATLGAIAIAVILLIVIAVNVARCGSAQDSTDASVPENEAAQDVATEPVQTEPSESSSTAAANTDEPLEEDKVQDLIDLIGEEEADKLLEAARTDPDALWIAAHPDEYAIDGIEVQVKILKLAANEPKAIEFVRSFPEQYPAEQEKSDSSLALSSESPSADVPDTKVPHFYQWDPRWGNTVYSSAAFGLTGCGPTSFAMVYQGVTGKTDLDPYTMGVLAQERGFMSQYNGTANDFFGSMAGELGMTYEELYPSAENLTDALKAGKVIIALLAPGMFTEGGHFFVLTGLTEDGKVILNDPYSYERSSQTWDADIIAQEATIFYAFTAA